MNTPELVEWQIMDETCGCVFPWFTHPFLEVLKTWGLKDKRILEWGGGRSTSWWASKAKHVWCVEANFEWAQVIKTELLERGLSDKVALAIAIANEGESDEFKRDLYINNVDAQFTQKEDGRWHYNAHYDIVIVDGILRYECMKKGIELLSEKGGILIVDNYQQDGFICPACAELIAPYEGHIYRQEDHIDHHGNPWQTAYWEIPAK